jgi:hypothetical protein
MRGAVIARPSAQGGGVPSAADRSHPRAGRAGRRRTSGGDAGRAGGPRGTQRRVALASLPAAGGAEAPSSIKTLCPDGFPPAEALNSQGWLRFAERRPGLGRRRGVCRWIESSRWNRSPEQSGEPPSPPPWNRAPVEPPAQWNHPSRGPPAPVDPCRWNTAPVEPPPRWNLLLRWNHPRRFASSPTSTGNESRRPMRRDPSSAAVVGAS